MHQIRTGERDQAEYGERRRRAFRLAVEGRCDAALAELTEGWTETVPKPGDYVADVARVRYLVGDYEHALVALDVVRGDVNREMTPLAIDCVRREKRLWRNALPIVVRRGSPLDRGRAAWSVVRAGLG
jgi:hypothetical protein